MTLIELFVFIVMISLGYNSAKLFYHIGGLWLAIPGFIAGVALIPFSLFLYDRYRKWAYRGDAWMPDCSCGSSKFKFEKVGTEYHLLCQGCRMRYQKRRNDVSIFENGVTRPYKRLVKYKGWI